MCHIYMRHIFACAQWNPVCSPPVIVLQWAFTLKEPRLWMFVEFTEFCSFRVFVCCVQDCAAVFGTDVPKLKQKKNSTWPHQTVTISCIILVLRYPTCAFFTRCLLFLPVPFLPFFLPLILFIFSLLPSFHPSFLYSFPPTLLAVLTSFLPSLLPSFHSFAFDMWYVFI